MMSLGGTEADRGTNFTRLWTFFAINVDDFFQESKNGDVRHWTFVLLTSGTFRPLLLCRVAPRRNALSVEVEKKPLRPSETLISCDAGEVC